MRRVVAAFDETDRATAAMDALREAGLDPEEPDVETAFFDPTVTMPERRGLRWGGLIGGFVGAMVLLALELNVFWVPRISPIMTAGPYALAALGFGLGVASGGFLGAVVGTFRRPPARDDPRVAVVVPDDRVDETTQRLREHGATTVAATVTHHEHPLRAKAVDGESS